MAEWGRVTPSHTHTPLPPLADGVCGSGAGRSLRAVGQHHSALCAGNELLNLVLCPCAARAVPVCCARVLLALIPPVSPCPLLPQYAVIQHNTSDGVGRTDGKKAFIKAAGDADQVVAQQVRHGLKTITKAQVKRRESA